MQKEDKIKHNLSTVVKGKKVLIDGNIIPASIHIRDGIIVKISGYEDVPPNTKVIDAENLVVMPGLVDTHVHVNEPGRTEWEGFLTATRAAAAGGVTTIVDMPLNSSPVTTSLEALNEKIKVLPNQCYVDVGLLGGVVPGNSNEITSMIEKGGVVGFKSFMVFSGIDEFPAVEEGDIRAAMEIIRNLKSEGRDVVLMFHAEVGGPIIEAHKDVQNLKPNNYSTFLASRPDTAETEAIEIVIRLAKEYNVHVHIVHLSSAHALDMIKKAKADGVQITVETTFHYLHLVAENVPDGNTLFKCCPPIRAAENREKLWQGLRENVIDMIVSDHSPCTVALKKLEDGNFLNSWGGIASLQLGLSLMWTEAKPRGFTLQDLSKWMCENTSRLVHLQDRKGAIKVGRDADLIIWDPEFQWLVDQSKLEFKNRYSPYHKDTLFGKVHKTILRGQVVFELGAEDGANVFVGEPKGRRVVPTQTESDALFTNPRLPPIERLNLLDTLLFKRAINLLFETAPPLFDKLYGSRPYQSYEHLIFIGRQIIENLSREDLIEVINAHPRIGLNPTAAEKISTLSFREQGLHNENTNDSEVERVYQQLRVLNEAYEQKFGHKFVEFVNGRPKALIVPVLEQRLKNDNHLSELKTGLDEMMKIASDRLKKLLPLP
eukprot:TRINITY_DN7904_c0_g2_i1.p1 TRINITY_DN7904_c0_g2~~TRINITY_DN7904_c0_g2_i1.p1  ORF type:complete len:683 (-),score=156.90 TRINITY_DN7904_c0_g2_i1:79-2052(-)